MKRGRFILLIAAALSSLSACVKESRINCPCYLLFAHDGFDNNGYVDDINLFVIENDQKQKDAIYNTIDMIEDKCDIPVHRGFPDVCGVGGIKYMDIDGVYDLVIPYGHQCDSIYAFHDDVTAQGERALVFGKINKQFATVFLDVNITFDGNIAVKVLGNSKGLDIRTMQPIEGYYGYVANHEENGTYTFRLPRQRDNNLDIEIWSTPEGYNPSDHTMVGCTRITSLNLGSIITDKLNYNWNADSLADIHINVDFITSMLTISVKEWNIHEIVSIDI